MCVGVCTCLSILLLKRLAADGEAYWWLLSSVISLLSGGTVQPENTYSCILKLTCQVWESQKRKSINTIHNYHQHSSPQSSMDWSINKVRFSFNQPIRKRWGARLVDVVKHLPHKIFFIRHHHYKGSEPKLKEAPSPHQGRLVLLDTNPVF